MTRRAVAHSALAALLVLAAACSDNTGPATGGNAPRDSLGGLIVSHPVGGPGGASGSARGLRSSPLVSGSVVYVSLVPGTVPDGMQATIQDQENGQVVTTAVVGGGFDPVAIAASVGDTLAVEITRSGSEGPVRALSLVRPSRPPVVVRTSPPRGGRDVPLNASMVIVFSEPLDSATADASSVKLWRGTAPLAGTLRFADAAHLRAEFHPDSLLVPQTDYQLVITTAIRDLNGLALDSAVTVPFTTGTRIAAIPYSIGGTVSGLAGSGLVLRLNTGEDLPVAANGPIAFASTLESGAAYSVKVLTLPSNPAQLCVVAGGDGNVASANVTDVAISCFGADPSLTGRILFTTMQDPAPNIFVLDLDRSTITRLTSAPDRDYMPQWSPDRSRIAFIRDAGGSPSGLWVMRADGSRANRISSAVTPGYGGASFSWSPDGSRLAFFDGRSFSMVNADGSGWVPLKDTLVGTYMYGEPAWSPDGSTIAFFGDTPDSGLDWFFQVLVMDADGSNVRRLTSATTYGGSMDPAERNPAWSPDGTKLAFWSAAYGLTVATRDGTAAYSASHDDLRGPNGFLGLSVQGDATPDWSPDGTHLVFQMKGQLFVTMADGSGNPRQLTSMPGGAFDPAWLK